MFLTDKKPLISNLKHIGLFLIFLVFCHSFSFAQSQSPNKFKTEYNKILQLIDDTRDSLERLITSMKNTTNPDDLQKAKINFIQSKLYVLYEIDPMLLETGSVSMDSIEYLSPLAKAENYIVQSRPDEGIPLIFQFLQTANKNSDSAVHAKIYLAEAYREKREYRKGIEIIYGLMEQGNISLRNKAFAYNRLAALYDECGNWYKNRSDSVVKYSNLCIDISKENNFTDYLAASQNELSFVYRQRKQYQLSLDYGLKAYDNFIKIDKLPQAINTAINLSKTYSDLGKLQLAKQTALNALKMGTVEENKNLFLRLYVLLAKINAEMENYRDAYEYMSIVRNMQTSFYRERINLQINEMSAKYETELKEKENILLKQNIKSEKRRSAYYRVLAIILSIIGMISLALFYFIRKNTLNEKRLAESEAKRLQERVDYQKRELVTSTLTLSRNLEFNNSLIGDVTQLTGHVNNEKAYASISRIVKKLEQQNTDKCWVEFETRFKEIHRGFYDRLHNRFEKLTSNDVKLCALLKMGMNTKEICAVTFQNVRAVEAARLRLRKKLNIDKGENLSVFLQKI